MLTLRSPYLTDGYTWLRGNLHCHTTLSDGTGRPVRLTPAGHAGVHADNM